MSEPAKAVFLSYAREDSAAAQRLADALRAFGIEVWFDQSELRGGDSWDTKIRTQIKSCTLFIPIVSAQTEARGEGYFRREWKLAVDRTHDMGAGRAFLVPVVIDDTKESGADVPEEFLRYQWIRLREGAPTPQFVEQVNRLLVSPRQTVGRGHRTPPESVEAAAAPARAPAGFGDPALQVRPASRWPLVFGGVAAVAIVAALFFAWRGSKPTPPVAGVADPGPAAAKPTTVAAPATSPTSAADAKSLAVLPFANMSEEKDAAFFADGVHEDLLTALAKVRDLKVISRTSVLGYRDTTKRNLRQIAEELGVAHILEGSVRRAGNKARITVQLIDARTDQHLWAESYDRDVSDIFAVQGEVAREITTALKATLTPNERKLIGRQLTSNAEAYEWFTRGRVLEQSMPVAAAKARYEEVIAAYTQAVERDPGFAQAWCQLSGMHGLMYWFGGVDPSPERRALAAAALQQAQKLAPEAPETRVAEGTFRYFCDNDWQGALDKFAAAEPDLPNDAQLHYRIAVAHRRLGQWAEAIRRFERSAELNPKDLANSISLVETLMLLRRYSKASATLERFPPAFQEDPTVQTFRRNAQLQRDRDWDAYLKSARSAAIVDEAGLARRQFNVALMEGDFDRALQTINDPRYRPSNTATGAVVQETVALTRAEVAMLAGRKDEAVVFAQRAIELFASSSWSPRQALPVRVLLARARLVANPAESLTEVRAALVAVRARDKMLIAGVTLELARTLAVVGRREEALEFLRTALAEPSTEVPEILRRDPYFRALRDDPRFDEALRNAAVL